jgi:hypothetical protein
VDHQAHHLATPRARQASALRERRTKAARAEHRDQAAGIATGVSACLNIGHFGHLEGDDGKRGIEACELWMRKIADLMERYPNVYADSGCSSLPVELDYQERYLHMLAELYREYPKFRRRFMYGSDFWLNKLAPTATPS